jgi:16S rRNA (cytosine967-C5)-methyltransferase
MDARAVAARILLRVVERGESLSTALPTGRYEKVEDKALIQELCFGTLRWHGRLSAILSRLLHKPLKKGDQEVEYLLKLGLYQLLYMRIPSHAVVHSTVQAAQSLGKTWAKGLINAVLRQFLRREERLLAKVDLDPEAEFSHPGWLLKRLQTAYPERWQQICQAANQRPPMTLRVNSYLNDVESYIEKLASKGMEAQRHAVVEGALSMRHAVSVERLPGFEQGLVTVQDAAAQLAVPLLACQPGMRVLDACAAPGGKTTHLLELLGGNVDLLAIDRDEKRLSRLRHNLQRSGWDAEIRHGDVVHPQTWWDGRPFDRILLDAPCSATGVIRRHPDIKLLRRSQDVSALQGRQYHMLQTLWPMLAEGGSLLYVTCSVLPEENALLVKQFVQDNKNATLMPPDISWTEEHEWGWQILPGERDMDGFYYALLRKEKLETTSVSFIDDDMGIELPQWH